MMHELRGRKKEKREKEREKKEKENVYVTLHDTCEGCIKTTNQHFEQMRNAISEQRGAAASTSARDLFIRLHPSSTASNLRPLRGIFTFPLL